MLILNLKVFMCIYIDIFPRIPIDWCVTVKAIYSEFDINLWMESNLIVKFMLYSAKVHRTSQSNVKDVNVGTIVA